MFELSGFTCPELGTFFASAMVIELLSFVLMALLALPSASTRWRLESGDAIGTDTKDYKDDRELAKLRDSRWTCKKGLGQNCYRW